MGDWAIAAAGACVKLRRGRIEVGRVVLAAVGSEVTCGEAEDALGGQPPTDELFARVGGLAAAACSPVADQRGSVRYKRHIAGVLTERTLRRATARARGETA